MVGGDQHCESLISSVEKALRPAGKLGRSGATRQGSHLDSLGVYCMQQNTGLEAVIASYTRFRQSKM